MPYELMYVVRPNVDETSLTAVTEKVDRMITAGGGEILCKYARRLGMF